MARKAPTECLIDGKKPWMDLLLIDFKSEKAFIIGYDGEITMTVPKSAFWHIVEQVEEGILNKEK